jgi:hypothetical protein
MQGFGLELPHGRRHRPLAAPIERAGGCAGLYQLSQSQGVGRREGDGPAADTECLREQAGLHGVHGKGPRADSAWVAGLSYVMDTVVVAGAACVAVRVEGRPTQYCPFAPRAPQDRG